MMEKSTPRSKSVLSGVPSNRKFAKYESRSSLQPMNLPPAIGVAAPLVPTNALVSGSESLPLLDYPMYPKKSEYVMRKPNIFLKELSFFVKVMEAKVRFDP